MEHVQILQTSGAFFLFVFCFVFHDVCLSDVLPVPNIQEEIKEDEVL